MIKVYSIAALLLVLVPSSVLAQRAGDAALGAVAGAVVLGPVRPNGAVASPAIRCRTRRVPPPSYRPSRLSIERTRRLIRR